MSKRSTVLLAVAVLSLSAAQADADVTDSITSGLGAIWNKIAIQLTTPPTSLGPRAERAVQRYRQLVAEREQTRRAREESTNPAPETP